MTPGIRDIEEIRRDLQSPEIPSRNRAIDNLLAWAKDDPAIQAQALEIFRAAWQRESQGDIAVSAIRGIERLAGPDEARAARMALLDHPQPQMAAYAALALERTPDYPKFISLLAKRPVTELHSTIVGILGRTRNPEMRGAITRMLAEPVVRPHAAQALGHLGDPAAIPDLVPYRDDPAGAWEIDNHGPMLSVGDVVREAIQRLRTPAIGDPHHGAGAILAPSRPGAAPTGLARWSGWSPYAPLAAALFSIPWFLMVIIPQIVIGGAGRTPAEMQVLDFVAMAPAAAGLVFAGRLFSLRAKRSLRQSLFLAIGSAACVLVILPFATEALTRDLSAPSASPDRRDPKPEPARPATIPAMPPRVDVRQPTLPGRP